MDWVTCAHSAACTGIARRPYNLCLAHLPPDQLADTIGEMAPGRLLDLRGTVVGGDLLSRLIEATGARPGRARLDRVRFTGDVRLSGVTFAGDVSLDGAVFERLASFFGARFEGNLSLADARFARELSMHGVTVRGHVSLDRAVMARDALFSQASFGRGLSCERARFDGYATFDGARLGDGATFRGARFGRTLSFRKVVGGAGFDAAHFAANAYLSATGRLSAARARSDASLDVSVTGCGVDLRRVDVAGTTTLRLTGSHADLEGAVLRGPATVTGRGGAALTSLRHVDARSLALYGLDLSACRFAGLAHPAGVRLKDCRFALTGRGVRVSMRRPMLRWFSRRSVLADERALRGGSRLDESGPGASAVPGEPREAADLRAGWLATLYAELGRRADDRGLSHDFAFAATEMRRLAGHRWWGAASWPLVTAGARVARAAGWIVLLAVIAAGAMLLSTAQHAVHGAPHQPPAVHH
ncbi:pentapeptide repeat-containing protein, partial [Nonomuraea sp. RK-328]|nr:pentapeptide repeat-containing protein [Nonomuraea sp. RK-328]